MRARRIKLALARGPQGGSQGGPGGGPGGGTGEDDSSLDAPTLERVRLALELIGLSRAESVLANAVLIGAVIVAINTALRAVLGVAAARLERPGPTSLRLVTAT